MYFSGERAVGSGLDESLEEGWVHGTKVDDSKEEDYFVWSLPPPLLFLCLPASSYDIMIPVMALQE